MTLQEISKDYEHAAQLLQSRIHLLRQQMAQTQDPEEAWNLRRRIAELTPMLTQMNELTQLTAHYYDRGYYRDEKYTMQRICQPAAKRSPAAASAGGHRQ